MKKISLLLLTVIISSLFADFGVLAADTDFAMSYDFNDYTAQLSSGEVPTEEWSYFSGGKAFGSDGNGALQLNWNAKPAINLEREVKCVNPVDSMHISFKAKTSGQLIVGTVKNNGNHNEDITGVNVGGRARHNMLKITPKSVLWDKEAGDGGCSTYSWSRPAEDTGWHRYDIVRDTNGSLTFYVDGVNIMTDIGTCKERAWGGLHGSAFSWIYFFENASSSTVDDVKVRVQKGSLSGLSMTKVGDERVERDNGVLDISLSEPVEAYLLTPEAFTISNNVTGEVVSNFEILVDEFNGMADCFTVKFGADTLKSGDYTVLADSSVTGLITNTSMGEGLVFKPAYKNLNGVVYPEAEFVRFLGIDGKVLELSDNMSAGVKEIVVNFNTIIDGSNIESYVVLEDESGIADNLVYEITEEDGKSILTIKITELLKPYEQYKFIISKGIPAIENTDVKSENDDEYSFKTAMPDSGGTIFGIIRNEVVKEENKYYFSVAKTTEDEAKLWAIATVYKTVTDSDGNEFDRLLECKAFPVVLNAEASGIFEYEAEFKTDLSGDDITVKTYLNDYPVLLPSGMK